MPPDPYVCEKFTRLRIPARKLAADYFERFPKGRYLTEIESWHRLQSDNIEFTMKRLRGRTARNAELVDPAVRTTH